MKPSEAMLVGIPLCKPWHDDMFGVNELAENCACGLGTIVVGYASSYDAAKAIIEDSLTSVDDLAALVGSLKLNKPTMKKVEAVARLWFSQHPCPECSGEWAWSGSAPVMVTHLNDHHEWSREDQAAWLATLGL